MRLASLILILCLSGVVVPWRALANSDEACKWTYKKGVSFDLTQLTLTTGNAANMYGIKDGDIPCTPDVEPSFSYMVNFCANIPSGAVPTACSNLPASAAYQYLYYADTQTCYVIGKYDANNDDAHFSLYKSKDPSKGISIKYASGDKCAQATDRAGNQGSRSVTIDVECANTKFKVLSAQEPSLCQYHIVAQSYYGCPVSCPVTSNGLCDGHGHCSLDASTGMPYCYCNEGRGGDSCSSSSSSSSSGSSSGRTVEIWLMAILLIIAVGLVGVVVLMVRRINNYRKEQVLLESQGTSAYEMVDQASPMWSHDRVITIHKPTIIAALYTTNLTAIIATVITSIITAVKTAVRITVIETNEATY